MDEVGDNVHRLTPGNRVLVVTHRFSMDDFEKAYDVFGDAAGNGALKVVPTRQEEADE